MSLKSDAAAEFHRRADDLERLKAEWPTRAPSLDLARDAVDEIVAIYRDAAAELMAPRERVKA